MCIKKNKDSKPFDRAEGQEIGIKDTAESKKAQLWDVRGEQKQKRRSKKKKKTMSEISLHTYRDEPRFEEKVRSVRRKLVYTTTLLKRAKNREDIADIREEIDDMRLLLDELEKNGRAEMAEVEGEGEDGQEEGGAGDVDLDGKGFVLEKLKNGVDECERLADKIYDDTIEQEGYRAGEEEEEEEEEAADGGESEVMQGGSGQRLQFHVEYTPVNAEAVEAQEQEALQREIEIDKIVNSVGELNQIFHDMDTLVLSQGEMVDNIESNIYNTLDNTRMASIQLHKANDWDRRRRRCSCLLMVVAVIGMLILLALIA